MYTLREAKIPTILLPIKLSFRCFILLCTFLVASCSSQPFTLLFTPPALYRISYINQPPIDRITLITIIDDLCRGVASSVRHQSYHSMTNHRLGIATVWYLSTRPCYEILRILLPRSRAKAIKDNRRRFFGLSRSTAFLPLRNNTLGGRAVLIMIESVMSSNINRVWKFVSEKLLAKY